MGLSIFKPSGSIPSGGRARTPRAPEPDPNRYRILGTEDVNGWTIAVIEYPGCTTYEGKKLLVYACPSDRVRAQARLDPHFTKGDELSPVARLEPTARGFQLARLICEGRA